jgi:hypothetical protein
MKKNSDVQFNQIKSIFEKAGDLENLLNEQIIQESKKKQKNLSANQSLNFLQLFKQADELLLLVKSLKQKIDKQD